MLFFDQICSVAQVLKFLHIPQETRHIERRNIMNVTYILYPERFLYENPKIYFREMSEL